ncbi:MAG: hypothetical protein RR437_08210 [Clostridium sp.]|uniref:hypothetical protein n=1 Tax=Clostridium sp. TaxID=1506 RepID=UPI002FCC9631
MNYDKIILEMLTRIQELEEKIAYLEDKVDFIGEVDCDTEDEDKTNVNDENSSGRSLARNEIIKILRDTYGYKARKANRAEGSGIVISDEIDSYRIKISYSRNYSERIDEETLCRGWHAISSDEILSEEIDYFICIVEEEGEKFHYFIFEREDLINEFADNGFESRNKLHLYLNVRKDGTVVENRGEEKNIIKYYNNWDIFKVK